MVAVRTSQVPLVVKNPPANAKDVRNVVSVPGLGISSVGGPDNPLQYSCLENPMDREAWQATVHGATKSHTRLKQLSTHTHGRNLDPTGEERTHARLLLGTRQRKQIFFFNFSL